MIKRDIFGKLTYQIGNLFVTRKSDINAKYAVLSKGAWSTSNATLMPVWDQPTFNSFVQAARFLQANHKDLF